MRDCFGENMDCGGSYVSVMPLGNVFMHDLEDKWEMDFGDWFLNW